MPSADLTVGFGSNGIHSYRRQCVAARNSTASAMRSAHFGGMGERASSRPISVEDLLQSLRIFPAPLSFSVVAPQCSTCAIRTVGRPNAATASERCRIRCGAVSDPAQYPMQYAYVELEDAGRRWTTFVCAFPETIDAPNIHRLLLALSLMQSSRAFGVHGPAARRVHFDSAVVS